MADQHGHGHGHTHDRGETVVVEERRGSGIGGVVAAIIGLIVVALIAWAVWAFAFGGGDGAELEAPENVDVQVETGGEG